MIKEQLDIFLITYNRAEKLKKTLGFLFAPNSPIKDFEILVIDNNSTDSTPQVVREFAQKFPNLKYKKNRYNIGGNANIARTFELAQKKYVWILCDDDEFCWDGWCEVEQAIQNEEEAIIVGNTDNPQLNVAQLFGQTSFLPSMIYKTSNIDEDVILNMQYNISNMFPHMVLSAKLINENKAFKIISNPVVIHKDDELPLEKTSTRGFKYEDLHPYMAKMSYFTGYANTTALIKDKKVRDFIVNKRRFLSPYLTSAEVFFDNEMKFGGSLYNLLCVFCALNTFEKIRFIFNWLMFNSLYRVIYLYKNEMFDEETSEVTTFVRARLFYYIKTRLFKFKRKIKGE